MAFSAARTIGASVGAAGEAKPSMRWTEAMLAMRRAVDALAVAPRMVLVDGNRCPDWPWPSRALVGGDAICLSIAAASIVAKHHRDTLMAEADRAHPGYGWASNKGYGSRQHLAALRDLGPTPLHRRSFAPVAQALLPL